MLQLPKNLSLNELTMAHFLSADTAKMIKKAKDIDALAARAQGEVNIREAIEELKVWCENTEFELLPYETSQQVHTVLIKGWKKIFTQISDQTALISAMKDYVYFAPFKSTALSIETKLNLLEKSLTSLNLIQRKWLYLEPIFGRGSLPAEQARFQRIDTDFRAIMEDVKLNPNIMNMAEIPNLEEIVIVLLDQLERCQRALNEFLEQKRSKFPRFYFIGDDDLLEILGQAQNPEVIQSHLKKLFAGINNVNFNNNKSEIIAMKSSYGEIVQLDQSIHITEHVEIWLQNLSNEMKNTLKNLLVKCINETSANLSNYPSQILCLSENIHFATKCEQAITNNTLNNLSNELKEKLESLIMIETDDILLQKKLKL